MTQTTHDVLVIGGGLVGASLACALDAAGLDVGLVESEPPRNSIIDDADARSLALAAASVNALDALGVLRHATTKPEPIRTIHVSRRGDFGSVTLRADEYGREAFGAVIPATVLGAALQARLARLRGLGHYPGARVIALREADALREVDILRDGQTTTLRACLLVGADGTASFVRTALDIAASTHDYEQHLFAGSVRAARPADGHAWERFTDDGPVALLPRAGGQHPSNMYGCICTVPAHAAESVAALDDAGFLGLLQRRFGWRAGRLLAVGRRSGHPLRQVVAGRLTASRAIIMGNAAQTLHPIGAQGFNLGLRDALTLAELVRESRADAGVPMLLDEYARRRAPDRDETLRFSAGLARLTAHSAPPLRVARSLALAALDAMPGLRARLVAGAMGFRGMVPALARDARPNSVSVRGEPVEPGTETAMTTR